MANVGDVFDETGKPRRNCGAIDQDAEFVLTFMDAPLRSLSRVVRIVDHQVPRTSEEESNGNWKALYLNLDYGWALIDMAQAPESLLINEIWHHHDDKPHSEKSISTIASLPTAGLHGLALHSICPMSVCTPRNSPRTPEIETGSEFMYLAGTENASCKEFLKLEYQDAAAADNGSWLVDPEDSKWWAIIVTEDRGKSYALPAQRVVQNIQKTMGVQEVRLPSPPSSMPE